MLRVPAARPCDLVAVCAPSSPASRLLFHPPMICDHLLCRALGSTCELGYGEPAEGVFDKHEDAPPDERLDQLEHDLAAIDLDALRIAIRAEQARRACQALLQ